MKNHNFILFGGALLFLATVALACGPYFPQAFLPHRDALLKAPIEGDFAFEMRRYFSRVRSAASAPRIQHTESPAALRAKAEAEGVTADQYRVIQRMRQEKDGDAAYAIGKELPDAIRLYTAGAVDYQLAKSGACAKMRQGTDLNFENSACNPDRCDGFGCDSLAPALLPANPAIARALARFEAVLSLPENERQPRATWAAYELAPDFYYAKGNYAAASILQFKNNTGSSARVYGRASMSEEEVQRFNVTVPRLDKRYHYRYLAVEKAREAARLLPARSQAYRSVLCHAAAWSPDDALDSDLYKTYLRNGSNKNYQLAGLFGRECETPDFEGARRFNSKPKAKNN